MASGPWQIVKDPDGIAAPKLQIKKNQKAAASSVGAFFKVSTSSSDNLLASAGASAHVDHAQTLSIPADTLNAGSVVRIQVQVAANQVDGTDTLEVKLYLGGTTLVTTTAFDPSAVTDLVNIDFTCVVRENASADSSIVGTGYWVTTDTGTVVVTPVTLAPTDFATNGALVVKVSSKWSSTTALTNANLRVFNVEIVP